MFPDFNTNKGYLKNLFIILILYSFNFFSFAQYSESFDYHREESPVISWNGIQMFDARLMSLGGISLLASNSFAASINPAMISSKSKLLFGISLNKMNHEAFQYWGINQGVIVSEPPQSDLVSNYGGFVCSLTIKGIRFSSGWTVSNLFQFPTFEFRKDYDYGQYYSYNGFFSGKENSFFVASAFKMGKSLNMGIKLEYISGKRDLEIKDIKSFYYLENSIWVLKPIHIKQEECHKISAIAPSVGLTVDLSPNWIIGTTLVYPLNGKVKRTITRTFENSTDNINISNTNHSSDTLYSPVKIYLGTRYSIPFIQRSKLTHRLVVGAESQYLLWSGYRYIFFEEEIPRNMRNTMVLSLGLEYGLIFSKGAIFLRVGYRHDPQPVMEPKTTLKVFTGGIGFRFGSFIGDIGFSTYSGTAGGIKQNHSIINGTLSVKIKGD